MAWQWQQQEEQETRGEFRVREQSGTERMHLSWEDPSVVPPNSREAKAVRAGILLRALPKCAIERKPQVRETRRVTERRHEMEAGRAVRERNTEKRQKG